MEYLHHHGIVHGNLSTWTCLLDSSWTVKVVGWAENSMLESERLLRLNINTSYESLVKVPPDVLMRMIFVHPDLLVKKSKTLTKLAPSIDAYSFGVMMIEIGTRMPLWMNKAGTVGWAQCVYDHCHGEDLRAEIFANDGRDRMPVEMTTMASQLLRTDGSSMTFSQITKNLKRASRAKGASIVDTLLSVMEEHATNLDDLIKQKTTEATSLNNEIDRILGQLLPFSIGQKLRKGEVVQPEYFENCTVLSASIVSFTKLVGELMPYQAIKILNNLCTDFDHIIGRHDVYKVEATGKRNFQKSI